MSRKKPTRRNVLSDAKMNIILTITESDIKGGKRKDNASCAAATALCRQENFKEALVFKTKTFVKTKDGKWLRYITPRSLYTELAIYDRGGRFEEGEHILKAPTGSQRLGYGPKPKGPKTLTGKPSRSFHITGGLRDEAPRGHNNVENMLINK